VERQIQEAISQRGLSGVTVSFIGDTAYLKGTVNTEMQRFSAEQAARSVPDVIHIFNGIWVNP
jgi:osmotically-inducible protein OsmY